MLERVHVLRILAAAYVTAGEANPQLIPRRADRHAIDAPIAARPDFADLAEMLAALGHRLSCAIEKICSIAASERNAAGEAPA